MFSLWGQTSSLLFITILLVELLWVKLILCPAVLSSWRWPLACRNQPGLFGLLDPAPSCQSEHQSVCWAFPSFTWSIMMVYRITVLSFTHSALISDRWLAFPFNITENSFPKHTDFFPPSDESTPDMRQSRKQTFFSVAVLTTVKCDLFKTRYMFLRGERGELRTVLKGNMSDWCQPPPFSWYVFFLSYMQVTPLVISYIGLEKDKFAWTF